METWSVAGFGVSSSGLLERWLGGIQDNGVEYPVQGEASSRCLTSDSYEYNSYW